MRSKKNVPLTMPYAATDTPPAKKRDKADPWYSTPRTKRKAKPTCLSLDAGTLDALDRLSKRWRVSRSRIVAVLVARADVALFAQSPELVEAALLAEGERVDD